MLGSGMNGGITACVSRRVMEGVKWLLSLKVNKDIIKVFVLYCFEICYVFADTFSSNCMQNIL